MDMENESSTVQQLTARVAVLEEAVEALAAERGSKPVSAGKKPPIDFTAAGGTMVAPPPGKKYEGPRIDLSPAHGKTGGLVYHPDDAK